MTTWKQEMLAHLKKDIWKVTPNEQWTTLSVDNRVVFLTVLIPTQSTWCIKVMKHYHQNSRIRFITIRNHKTAYCFQIWFVLNISKTANQQQRHLVGTKWPMFELPVVVECYCWLLLRATGVYILCYIPKFNEYRDITKNIIHNVWAASGRKFNEYSIDIQWI